MADWQLPEIRHKYKFVFRDGQHHESFSLVSQLTPLKSVDPHADPHYPVSLLHRDKNWAH